MIQETRCDRSIWRWIVAG